MSCYGRPNPVGLENMGKPWKEEEINQILSEIKEKKDYQTIAQIHKRTVGGITGILRQSAARFHLDEKKTIDECIEITGLEKADILDAIDKREYSLRAKKSTKIKVPIMEHQPVIYPARTLDPMAELRCEVNELKKDVKEILRLMNALYEFEASQS
jgi:hypothetical protein